LMFIDIYIYYVCKCAYYYLRPQGEGWRNGDGWVGGWVGGWVIPNQLIKQSLNECMDGGITGAPSEVTAVLMHDGSIVCVQWWW
jgi:hypothetical protein